MRAPNGSEIASGHLGGRRGPVDPPNHVVVDNRTDLPDDQVMEAVQSHWVTNAALQFGGTPSSFQMYATNHGTMLTRTPFRTPSNVIEEIKLARDVADTDDDVRATMSQMIATAYGDGMENLHEDERTLALFNQIAGNDGLNLDLWLRELHREWLIASSVTTLSLFTRKRMTFSPNGTDTRSTAQLQVPNIGILPAENIRVISNDVFGTGRLAYDVTEPNLRMWLDEFFGPQTSAARRAEMAREEPIIAAIFIGRYEVPYNDADSLIRGRTLYVLNPRLVKRTTMEKGAAPYPRPLLTANFALLEAKRLLNIMDYALLQGGTNYIVIAKQGSDKQPAKQPEVDALAEQVQMASRSGVLVGDHRVSIEIVTPKLDELLNKEKRTLLGRKLAMLLLRIPEPVTDDPGAEGARSEMEFTGRTITSDRRAMKRHVESTVYEETANRNPSTFTKGPPKLWFPKIVLSGVKDFFAAVTSARDRGDIPRRWAVEVLGYDYDAAVAERKREKARGDDEVLTPGAVPFDAANPGAGGAGRPPGGSPNNGAPGARPAPGTPPGQRARPSGGGEPVRASWEEELGRVLRIGEITAGILEEYGDYAVGRITAEEREAATTGRKLQRGPLAVIPVNPGYEVRELRALRLEDGLGMIVGERITDGAMVAKALCFREPIWTPEKAEETALRWGFTIDGEDIPEEHASLTPAAPQFDPQAFATALTTAMTNAMAEVVKNLPVPNVTVQMPGSTPMRLLRDESGAIVGSEPVPAGE